MDQTTDLATHQPPISPDGRWWWNGQKWLPTSQPTKLVREPILPGQPIQLDQMILAGYRIVYRDADYVTLRLDKPFSAAWAIFWFFFGLGIGLPLYIIYWASQRSRTVQLVAMPSARS